MPNQNDGEGAGSAAAAESSQGGSDPFESARLPGNEDTPATPPAETKPTPGVEGEGDQAGNAGEATAEAKTPEELEAEAQAKADTNAAAAAAPKLLAGQYKTPQELEAAHIQQTIAYKHSSNEGKRLALVVKDQAAASEKVVGELRDKIAELEILAEAGPEIAEPTDEQLEAMGPVKATRLLQKISDRKANLARLKSNKDARDKESKNYEAQLREHIKSTSRKMELDPVNFPDYVALMPEINEILDMEPGITGWPESPRIAYLAAFGRRALKLSIEARKKTKESTDAAALQSRAGAAGAGAAGASGGAKDPAGKKPLDDNGDKAYNDNIVKKYRERNRNPLLV